MEALGPVLLEAMLLEAQIALLLFALLPAPVAQQAWSMHLVVSAISRQVCQAQLVQAESLSHWRVMQVALPAVPLVLALRRAPSPEVMLAVKQLLQAEQKLAPVPS